MWYGEFVDVSGVVGECGDWWLWWVGDLFFDFREIFVICGFSGCLVGFGWVMWCFLGFVDYVVVVDFVELCC